MEGKFAAAAVLRGRRKDTGIDSFCDKNIGEFVAGKLPIRDWLERFEFFPAELCVLSKRED
jgi:hypothetical protein